MNFIFNDNVRILCLSCNVKKIGKLVRFKQKGRKQASFLAFHKCCQGCLLRGPRYISTSFILVCALRCYIATGYQESLFVGWKVYSSSTNKAKIYSYSIYVQQMYWLQDKRFILQSVHLLYIYAIRINVCFIRTRRINFSYYTNKLFSLPNKLFNLPINFPGTL